jgi:hypothetical protein
LGDFVANHCTSITTIAKYLSVFHFLFTLLSWPLFYLSVIPTTACVSYRKHNYPEEILFIKGQSSISKFRKVGLARDRSGAVSQPSAQIKMIQTRN